LFLKKNGEETEEPGDICPEANKNPTCPYITAIHNNTVQVNRIEKALVGEDLQSGLVSKVQQLEVTQKILVALGSATLVGWLVWGKVLSQTPNP
jgi:hypothetical protein